MHGKVNKVVKNYHTKIWKKTKIQRDEPGIGGHLNYKYK